MQFRGVLAWGVLGYVGLVLGGGCAASTEPVEDDDGSGGQTAQTTTTSGAGGGMGGMGTGGDPGPCGQDCSAIDTPQCLKSVCNDGSYAGAVGECVVVNDDGAACDDGAFCTVDDVCQAGACVGGGPNDCGMSAPECQEIACDEASDSCSLEPIGNGDPCSSTDLCLTGTTCNNGVCGGGTPKDCFLAPVPNECHVSVCNPNNGMCEPEPGNDGATCVDQNDLCSEGNTCAAGVCGGGMPKNCSHLTMGCDLGVCDAGTGQCITMAVPNNQLCDDLDACTTGEICTSGTCGGGTPVTNCSLTGDGCCPSNCTAVNDLDCQCMTSTVSTGPTPASGWDGIMFDIEAKSTAIEIKSFAADIDPGMKTIEIYYKVGTFNGFETNAGAWTLVGSASVNPAASGVPTAIPVNVDVTIPANSTYGWYVVSTAGGTLNNGVNYLTDATSGALYTEDANMRLIGGKGKGTGFAGSTFSNRGFSGDIVYEKCGN